MKTKTINSMGSLFKSSETVKCSEGLKNFQLIIDGEATEEQVYRLMNHLSECKSCDSTFNLDKTLKNIIKARIQNRPCPQHLVNIIRAKLTHND